MTGSPNSANPYRAYDDPLGSVPRASRVRSNLHCYEQNMKAITSSARASYYPSGFFSNVFRKGYENVRIVKLAKSCRMPSPKPAKIGRKSKMLERTFSIAFGIFQAKDAEIAIP